MGQAAEIAVARNRVGSREVNTESELLDRRTQREFVGRFKTIETSEGREVLSQLTAKPLTATSYVATRPHHLCIGVL